MRALINPNGQIDKLTVIFGNDSLRAPTLDAIGKWVYKPYFLNGSAVLVETTVKIDF